MPLQSHMVGRSRSEKRPVSEPQNSEEETMATDTRTQPDREIDYSPIFGTAAHGGDGDIHRAEKHGSTSIQVAQGPLCANDPNGLRHGKRLLF